MLKKIPWCIYSKFILFCKHKAEMSIIDYTICNTIYYRYSAYLVQAVGSKVKNVIFNLHLTFYTLQQQQKLQRRLIPINSSRRKKK